MPVADPKSFTDKGKPITYIGVFVKLYNQRNRGQVHEIHGIIELEKMRTSMAKYPHNLDVHCIVKISSILHSTHVVLRNQERIVFYVNNYIN